MSQRNSPVTRVLNLVKLDRYEISSIYLYAILNGVILLTIPLGVQAIINFVVGASMRISLVILIAAVVAGTGITGLLQIRQMKLIEKIQQKIFVRYSFGFASHIPRLDLKKNDSYYIPELVNRFFEVAVLQKGLAKILLDIPAASIQILIGLILLSFYHPAFIIFGLTLILILWLILRFSGHKGLDSSFEECSYKYKVAAWLQETARVIKSIKLVKNNDLHLRRTDEYVTNYLQARNRHFKVLLFQYNVLIIFKMVITAATLIVGTLLLLDQSLNIGQFIAAEIVIILVLNSVEKLILNLGTVYDILTAVEKISKLTDKPLEENGTIRLPDSREGLKLEMKGLSFGFDSDAGILRNIDLLALPGNRIAITGKESMGKSTLLRLMAGAYTDFKGSYLIDDIPVGNYDLASLRAHTGVLLNLQDIFHGTLWENISLGNEQLKPESVVELARKTGLDKYISTLPKGYHTEVDPTGKKLPRNVIQKILLVRALAARPRLLLLEDPFTDMESELRESLMQLLQEQQGCTIAVATNDEAFIRTCDQVIKLEESSIINHS